MCKVRLKSIAALLLLGLCASQMFAQSNSSNYCKGLKNPINFTLYNSAQTGLYTGKTGSKPSTASNCNTSTVGMSFNTDVSNSSLATVTSSASNSYCGSTINNDTRFRIMTYNEGPGTGNNLGKDPCTNYQLPYCPPGYTNSIRVGNCRISAEAEALYYTMQVSPENALVFINYAIVIQAPGHGLSSDPEFVIRVTEQNSQGNWIPISDTMCYVVSSTPSSNGGTVTIGQDGWHSYGSSYDAVYFRDWKKVAINLYNKLYHTVRIEVMIGDCSASGHYGYCYIAGDCQRMKLDVNGCAAGNTTSVAKITAPAGLASYQWYRSNRLLQPAEYNNPNNFTALQNTDSVLDVTMSHLMNGSRDTLIQNTFKCVMTSYMDPQKVISSTLFADVSNKKPSLSVDTVLSCDGTVWIRDRSQTPWVDGDTDRVDTTLTEWKFYNVENVGALTQPVYSATGAHASYRYPNTGTYSVKVTTHTGSSLCWNEKTVKVRALETPMVTMRHDDNICIGDQIELEDRTPNSIYHKWSFLNPATNEVDTSFESPNARIRYTFDRTTNVKLESHTRLSYRADANGDGVPEQLFCNGIGNSTVHVGDFPVLSVSGDTIVCNGTQAVVSVSSSVAGCSFQWFKNDTNSAVIATGGTMTDYPARDTRYYIRVTTPNNCSSWDSLDVRIVSPTLNTSGVEMCTDDKITLWSSRAATYTWTATPDDPSMDGQEENDTIVVSPTQTTTYAVVGHGTNGCDATALTQKITVFPYPIPAFELTPGYIDSENPSVQFTDISQYGTSTLWNFGNGQTSTTRSVVHTFTDLSQDSIAINLTSTNAIGCPTDTTFFVPVGIFSVWYPNAFTPRLDINNVFKAYTNNVLSDYDISIFDRHGTMVFHSNNVEEGWDGTYKGKECMPGAFVYYATYRREGIERQIKQKGTVILIK